jgi:hypothetical protein
MIEPDAGLRRRVMIVAALAATAVVLLVLDRPIIGSSDPQQSLADLRPLDGIVDSLLVQYGVHKEKVRKWQVRTPDGRLVRTERRVLVPASFMSVEFNRDLNRAVTPRHARVAATERTKESVVILHIVQQGATVLTVSLVEDANGSR